MNIIADTHVHLYPCYQLELALSTLINKLDTLVPDAIKAGFLVERSDCCFYAQLEENGHNKVQNRHDFFLRKNNGYISVVKDGSTILYLFPGRQIVTSERIEILSLTSDKNIKDGSSAKTTIDQILDGGGIPVISWAPGKWFFKRGGVIEKLIERMQPGKILVGDTSLRPTIWKKPLLMKKASKMGYKVLAGSDPLPFPGEEMSFGIYASLIRGSFQAENAIHSIRLLLKDPETEISQ